MKMQLTRLRHGVFPRIFPRFFGRCRPARNPAHSDDAQWAQHSAEKQNKHWEAEYKHLIQIKTILKFLRDLGTCARACALQNIQPEGASGACSGWSFGAQFGCAPDARAQSEGRDADSNFQKSAPRFIKNTKVEVIFTQISLLHTVKI